MSISKHPLIPHLVRQVPEQFSWIDHRLVRDRHIDALGSDAAALYLFLVTVGGSRGLSYYGDKSIGARLGLSDSVLVTARDTLVRQGLIAWKHPLYQVLALEPRRENSGHGPCSMREILQQMNRGGR